MSPYLVKITVCREMRRRHGSRLRRRPKQCPETCMSTTDVPVVLATRDRPCVAVRTQARAMIIGAVLTFSRPIRGRAAKLSSRCQRRQQSLDTKITINFHDQAAPDLYDLDQGSNALLFRGLVPHKLGGIGQLLRYTLPVVTAPDGQGGTVTGLGDLNVLDLFPFALKESLGQAGRWQSPYHDTMIDHDKNVGSLLDYLDKLGIADNTFVMYSTDNGPHRNSWPDGGMTPFRSEKNTNWEGAFGFRCSCATPARSSRERSRTRSFSTTTGCRRSLSWPATRHRRRTEERRQGLGRTYKNHIDGYSLVAT